jgi:hypothetical protein
MSTSTLYLRIKRQQQTIFMNVFMTDQFSAVKSKTAKVLGVVDVDMIRLIGPDKVLLFELHKSN